MIPFFVRPWSLVPHYSVACVISSHTQALSSSFLTRINHCLFHLLLSILANGELVQIPLMKFHSIKINEHLPRRREQYAFKFR